LGYTPEEIFEGWLWRGASVGTELRCRVGVWGVGGAYLVALVVGKGSVRDGGAETTSFDEALGSPDWRCIRAALAVFVGRHLLHS